jgi:drug/metabolite transporter (DMT)-like permease
MSRLQADFLLLITALIWGTAFIAQKTGMEGLGPYGFVGVRFALSLLVVLPLAFLEYKKKPAVSEKIKPIWAIALCLTFVGGVILQQIGIKYTSVTNAGFLTGLYVVGVPFAGWLIFRRRPAWIVLPACLLALTGTWFLNGASLTKLNYGDLMVILCAASFALQVVLIGYIVQKTSRPLFYSVLQYGACAVVGMILAIFVEHISWDVVMDNAPQLLYAGVVSGGIAYTLQAVAQQHTPASDAAVILAGEALFAALAGMILLGDRLDGMGWFGCGLIFTAIILVEVGALFLLKRRRA